MNNKDIPKPPNKNNKFTKKDFLESIWFYKLIKSIFKDKNRCIKCNQRLTTTEYKPYCWKCYYQSLKTGVNNPKPPQI